MIKKSLFLFLGIFLLTGCYDYQELNDRAIIVGVAVDYVDEEFVVNFEVLNSQKSGSEQSGSNPSYLVEGKDKSFTLAYQNALFSLNKDAYLAHLKTAVFSEEIAKNYLKSVVEYLIRDPNTRNIFYPVVAKGNLAKEILKATNSDTPVVSEAIEGLIDYNNFKESISVDINFENFLELLFSDKKDAYLNIVSLDNDKRVRMEGLAIFNKFAMVKILNQEQSATLELLNNKSKNYYLQIGCDNKVNKYLTVNLYDAHNTEYEIDEEKVLIKGFYSANILDDECDYNFKDAHIYKTLEEKLQSQLDERLRQTAKYFFHLKSDVLGIQKKYFIKNRKDLNNWDSLDVESKSKIELNKNGVIFRGEEDD